MARHLAGHSPRPVRALPVEFRAPTCSFVSRRSLPYAEVVDRRRLLQVPAHIATKVAALLDRPDSLPGRKDRQELLSLLSFPASSETPAVIKAASARTASQVGALIDQAFVFLAGESNLTRQDRARLRQMAQRWHRVATPDPSGDLSRDRSRDRGIDL